jgi:hypothetical protein
MSDYTPRAGTKAYAALQYFQQNSDQELSTQQLAGLLGIDVKAVPALIGKAEATQLLTKRKLGNGYVWALGERKIDDLALLPPDDAAEEATGKAEDDVFSFALWHDGELMINGAAQTEHGIQLTVQQTARLVAYLTSTAAYVEYLGQQA